MGRRLALCMVIFALALSGCAGLAHHGVSDKQVALGPAEYAEKQKAELQACMAGFAGAEVERWDNNVTVAIRCDTLFQPRSAQMDPARICHMDAIAGVVKKYPHTRLKVDAYTDCVRSEEENLELTEMQAGAIKEALVCRGVDGARITARGWGESRPIASNATEDGRQANRRLTITLAPVDSASRIPQ